jgi:hypothetical protein
MVSCSGFCHDTDACPVLLGSRCALLRLFTAYGDSLYHGTVLVYSTCLSN